MFLLGPLVSENCVNLQYMSYRILSSSRSFCSIVSRKDLRFRTSIKRLNAKNDDSSILLLLEKCTHLNQFKEIYVQMIISGLARNPFPVGRLLSATATSGICSLFSFACSIFRLFVIRNTFMYNTMIRGYVESQKPASGIFCYMNMLKEGLLPNNYTYPPLIKACNILLPSSKQLGYVVHNHVIKVGCSDDAYVLSSFIVFYSMIPNMEIAYRLFHGCLDKDVVLYTAMVDGYARSGCLQSARKLFDEIPKRNSISWSAMIAGYSRVGDFKEVLTLFRQMQESQIKPNESILASVLTACAQLGAFTQGLWVHSYMKRRGLSVNPILGTALIDMYMRCGHVETALLIFGSLTTKDTGAWNAVISGVAMNGDANKALALFTKMKESRAEPNEITLVAVLCACTHAGLVNEGIQFFHSMVVHEQVEPRLEHYACLIDLLARSGQLTEAEDIIEQKLGGFQLADANVWGALLNACRIYKNVEVAHRVWKRLDELGVSDCGMYVLLYNTYKEAGWELEAMKMRTLITVDGLKKKPGCSSLEVNGTVNEFFAGDFGHPQAVEICEMIDLLNKVIIGNEN